MQTLFMRLRTIRVEAKLCMSGVFIVGLCLLPDTVFSQPTYWGEQMLPTYSEPLTTGQTPIYTSIRTAEVRNNRMYKVDMYGVNIVDISNPALPQLLGRVRTPGVALRLAVDSPYVYVAERFGLSVVNFTSPTAPTVVNFTPIGRVVGDIVLRNNVAFLATTSTIEAYDVSNPTSPSYLSSLFLDSASLGIHIQKHPALPILYCAANTSSRTLYVVNVANPSAMQITATQDLPGGGTVYSPPMVEGNRLYVAHTLRLVAFNISTPAQPAFVYSILPSGSQSMYSAAMQDTFYYHTHWQRGWWVSSVADSLNPRVLRSYQSPDTFGVDFGISTVQGRYLYLANEGRTNVDKGWSVRIIDVLNPMNAQVVGIAQSPSEGYGVAHCILQRGNRKYALVVQNNSRRSYSGSWTYGGLLRIVDVTDPHNPTMISTTDFSGTPIAVASKDSIAVVRVWLPGQIPNFDQRMHVFAIANLAAPLQTQDIVLTPSSLVSTAPSVVRFFEDRLYVLDKQSLSVYRVNPDFTVTLLGSGGVPNANPLLGIQVRRIGTSLFAYLAAGGGTSVGGFLIFNVTNPSGMFLWSAFDTPGVSWDVALQGNYAYVADGAGGVWIFDISNNVAQPLTNISLSGEARVVAIANNLLYVLNVQGTSNSNIQVFDVSNPNMPVNKGVSLNRFTNHLTVSEEGRELYVTSEYDFRIRRPLFNYRPLPFRLSLPADSSTVSGPITFVWRRAFDANDDTLTYRLRMWRSGFDSTITVRSDTSAVLNTSAMAAGWYSWTVSASDSEFVVASPDTFDYRLVTTGVSQSDGVPTEFAVHQNYPNPFNPVTTIRFDLPENSTVSFVVYDVLGRTVAELVNGRMNAGYHQVEWNASHVASGVYLARFTAIDATGSVKLTRIIKLLLTK